MRAAASEMPCARLAKVTVAESAKGVLVAPFKTDTSYPSASRSAATAPSAPPSNPRKHRLSEYGGRCRIRRESQGMHRCHSSFTCRNGSRHRVERSHHGTNAQQRENHCKQADSPEGFQNSWRLCSRSDASLNLQLRMATHGISERTGVPPRLTAPPGESLRVPANPIHFARRSRSIHTSDSAALPPSSNTPTIDHS